MKTTLTSKGQITVPKRIRDRLGWERGLVLEVCTNEKGAVELVPLDRDPLEELFGSLQHLVEARDDRDPVTDEEIRRAIRQRATEKFRGEGDPGE